MKKKLSKLHGNNLDKIGGGMAKEKTGQIAGDTFAGEGVSSKSVPGLLNDKEKVKISKNPKDKVPGIPGSSTPKT